MILRFKFTNKTNTEKGREYHVDLLYSNKFGEVYKTLDLGGVVRQDRGRWVRTGTTLPVFSTRLEAANFLSMAWGEAIEDPT